MVGEITLINFGLYCDIAKHLTMLSLNKTEINKHIISGIIYKDFLIRNISKNSQQHIKHLTKRDENSTFLSLIDQCDKQTLHELVEWFDKDAPIQKVLQKKIEEYEKIPIHKSYNESEHDSNAFFIFLCELIDNRGYNSDADFYNYAGISRQSFSKLRNQKNSRVSREMAIHLAVALELDYNNAKSLLNTAGYSLKSTSRREAIISYVMRNKKYTFQEMNEILFLFGEKTFLES